MAEKRALAKHISWALTGLVGTLASLPGVLSAQSSTATIRGHASASAGRNGQVIATNIDTGAIAHTKIAADGSYTLAGLPSGSYQIETNGGAKSAARTVSVQIGQSLTLDLSPGNATNTTTLTAVNVHASATPASLIETRTSEVATNVSQEQIKVLPQSARNFLNFAALAPGISVSQDAQAKTFSAAGLPANQVNVFIDGASLKNNTLQGGLVGQDSSKGNPFSQEAIKEFRVLTQNYKAEYEQAGSAIINAVTKSGTNDFHGSVYDYVQTRGMVNRSYFQELQGDPKPAYRRQQYGATFGGPIIKDKLQFFLNFEGNKEDGSNDVYINNPAVTGAGNKYGFEKYNGSYSAPFREKVWFGKLSWHPNAQNDVNLSYSDRRDRELIGFGGTDAYEARQNRTNKVTDLLLKWQYRGDAYVSDFMLDEGSYKWSPQPVSDQSAYIYEPDVATLGGAAGYQDKQQKNFTLREDLTFDNIDWHGQHVIKVGAKWARVESKMMEHNDSAPHYLYSPDENGYDTPYEVDYSPQEKSADIYDNQYGIYAQDDWDVTRRLQLNLGIRWDYDANAYNNHYVSTDLQRQVVENLGLGSNYLSDGSNRKPFKWAIQPRLGFSLDISPDADQSTTVFGGAGRYYDRTPYDNLIQEDFSGQGSSYNLYFTPNGTVNTHGQTLAWSDAYYDKAALNQLIASQGTAGREILLMKNGTRPPHTDQFSLGIRQVMGDWVASLTLGRILSYDQFTWIWGNHDARGNVIPAAPGVTNVLVSTSRSYRTTNALVSLDKPYTDESGWGFGMAYTYMNSKAQGDGVYSLDWPTPGQYPTNHVGEKHHLVFNGSVHLPWDLRLSSVITLGSGTPFTKSYSTLYNGQVADANNVIIYDPNNGGVHPGSAYPKKSNFIIPHAFAYRQVDISLSKTFRWGKTQALEFRADAFNVFNFRNFSCFQTGVSSGIFGQPACITGPTRSYQLGARYSF